MAPSVQPSSSPLRTSEGDEKYANVEWEELGFALTPTDCMYVAKCRQGRVSQKGRLFLTVTFQSALVVLFSIMASTFGKKEDIMADMLTDTRRLLLQNRDDPKGTKNLWEEWTHSCSHNLQSHSSDPCRLLTQQKTHIRKLVFLIWFAYLLVVNKLHHQSNLDTQGEDGDQGWTLCALLAPMNDVRSKRSE
ncbi:hypothetical protein Bca52824_033462 [Brassica carinata]|uniref:Uncharacterized protein n=1 Tax=Brassica carinata TaxID=52824 RepID=A0A8X7SE92_BRACI|nr:hypothetical protein Bca52824_033462 [Brassica carinata]